MTFSTVNPVVWTDDGVLLSSLVTSWQSGQSKTFTRDSNSRPKSNTPRFNDSSGGGSCPSRRATPGHRDCIVSRTRLLPSSLLKFCSFWFLLTNCYLHYLRVKSFVSVFLFFFLEGIGCLILMNVWKVRNKEKKFFVYNFTLNGYFFYVQDSRVEPN